MADYTTSQIRNIALVGHGQCGKTTLAEAMLHAAGATTRLGRTDDGSSILDFEEEERARKFSIYSAIAHCRWQDCEINLIDTPGYPDFVGEVLCGLAAVDAAVVVVSATTGVELNTRKVWAYAEKAGIPRLIVVTKTDGEGVNFAEVLSSIQDAFGVECAPVTLPVMTGGKLAGVVSTVDLPDPLPDGVEGDAAASAEALMDAIVQADDEVMEKYLEGEEIAPDVIQSLFCKAILAGTLVPVVCCAGESEIGIKELLDAVVTAVPPPSGTEGVTASTGPDDEDVTVAADPDATFSAQVFKSVVDQFVGKLSYFRVRSGKLSGDLSFVNVRTGKSERVTNLLRAMGKEQEQVTEAVAGDILAVAKLEEAHVGDSFCDAKTQVTFAPINLPTPMVALAVEPKSRGDEQKISGALAKLADQDPTFLLTRDRQTREMVVSGMSALHLEIMFARLKEQFAVDITTKQPKIPYRETLTMPAEGHYRHKKQTGGRGQFGEVYLRVEPIERGEAFEFVDKIVGGAIPNQFIPAVEKGIREILDRGILAGYPVVDARAEVYDGKHHEVDSSEASFKIAGARAFQEAFMQAKPVLLEPIVNIEVTIPSEFMGDVTGNLTSRRARIAGMDSVGDFQIVKAQVPLAEIARYGTELNSMTGGQGSYTVEFSHYDIVPSNLAQAVIEQSKKPTQEES